MNTIEPTIRLTNGAVVSQALFEWIADLIARGHTIRVDDECTVSVVPPCHPDTLYHLQASWSDTAAVLAEYASGDATVH